MALQGWRAALMHFRGCSGEPNRLPRGYHAGETGDLNTFIAMLRRSEPRTPLAVIGYSLGGNVVLKWLGEQGSGGAGQRGGGGFGALRSRQCRGAGPSGIFPRL